MQAMVTVPDLPYEALVAGRKLKYIDFFVIRICIAIIPRSLPEARELLVCFLQLQKGGPIPGPRTNMAELRRRMTTMARLVRDKASRYALLAALDADDSHTAVFHTRMMLLKLSCGLGLVSEDPDEAMHILSSANVAIESAVNQILYHNDEAPAMPVELGNMLSQKTNR